MKMTTLQNDRLSVQVSQHGAELTSIRLNGQERLWNADGRFWGRHAPILFPIVGKVWNNQYRVGERSFSLGQHGFARDSEFEWKNGSDESVSLELGSSPQTLEVYPYTFRLRVEYALDGLTIHNRWTVVNSGDAEMWFQIGAHPAFLLPEKHSSKEPNAFIQLNDREPIPLMSDTFQNDAIIIEDGSIRTATLLDAVGCPTVAVRCPNAQVWGLWAPYKEGCPFVCLEPWCGRKDKEGYLGDFSQRDYMHSLASGEEFHFDYDIELYV